MKHNSTRNAIALVLFSAALGACSGVDSSDGSEGSMTPEAQASEPTAVVTLDNGFQAKFYAEEDGTIHIGAKAKTADLSQMESFEDFDAARAEGLTASEIYELLSGEEAPQALVDAEALQEELRSARASEEDDADAPEVPEDAPAQPGTEGEGELQPLYSGSDFRLRYCDRDIWDHYHADKDTCKTDWDGYFRLTGDDYKREGVHTRMNNVSGTYAILRHHSKKNVFAEFHKNFEDYVYAGECVGWTTTSGDARKWRSELIVGSDTQYHVYAAILEDD